MQRTKTKTEYDKNGLPNILSSSLCVGNTANQQLRSEVCKLNNKSMIKKGLYGKAGYDIKAVLP